MWSWLYKIILIFIFYLFVHSYFRLIFLPKWLSALISSSQSHDLHVQARLSRGELGHTTNKQAFLTNCSELVQHDVLLHYFFCYFFVILCFFMLFCNIFFPVCAILKVALYTLLTQSFSVSVFNDNKMCHVLSITAVSIVPTVDFTVFFLRFDLLLSLTGE